MYHVDEETRQKVYESFGRTAESVNKDVEIVKDWIKTQHHLPEIMEDVKIRNFLNLNKFSIEKTKEKIDMYYTIRSLIPEIFERSNPKLEYNQKVLETTYISTHPKLIDGMHRVWLCKPKQPDTYRPADLVNVWFAIFELRLYEDFMVDDIVIVDMSTISFNDLKRTTPSLISKFIAVYKKVYSLRLRSLIYVNSPSYISMFLPILKAVMSPKIFERVQVHQDMEVLKTIFDQESLPKDYGGDGPSLQELNDVVQTKLSQYQDRFDRLDALKVDENLRPEKLNNDEILGYYGSFKKIDVD